MRDHARVNLALWGDEDFLDLTPLQQHLYLALWTSPKLTYCGGGDWRAGRVAALARGWTADQVNEAAAGLAESMFVIFDADTEEFLIRSWIKHDGLWRTPNMAVSVANARAALSSRTLRGVVVHEVRKIRDANPESSSWVKDSVASMLEQRAIDPAEVDPLTLSPTLSPTHGLTHGLTLSATHGVNPCANPKANPGSNPPPTTATTTTTNYNYKKSGAVSDLVESESAPKRATKGSRLLEDWRPSQTVIDAMRAERPNVDMEAEHRKFVDYWIAQPGQKGVKVNWDATWRNWIRNARANQNTHRDPTRSEWDGLKTDTTAQIGM